MQANIGKTQSPKALEGVQNSLTMANQKLQDEANQYTSSQQAKQQYAVGNDDLEKAIGSQDPNSAERKKASELLNRQTINQVDMWKPQTDYEVEDSRLLNNDAGLQELASRGMGPRYTAGEAAFDVRALRKTPGFTNLIRQLQGQQQDLRSSAEKDRAKEIEDYGKQNLTTAQTGARNYLTQQESAIDAQNDAEAKSYNEQIAALKASGIGKDKIDALEEQARQAALARLDPRYARVAGGLGVDIDPYLSYSADQGRDQFVDDSEARRFNSIMGLLGQGGPAKAAALPVGPQYSVNQDGLNNAMIQRIQMAREAEDNAQRAKLNEIMGGLHSAKDQRLKERDANAFNQALDTAYSTLQDGDSQRYGISPQEIMNQINLRDYYNPGGGDWNDLDFADQGTAAEINAINADLGGGTAYGAGRNFTEGVNFKQDAYRDAIMNVLRNMGRLPEQAPGAGPNGNTNSTWVDQFKDTAGGVGGAPSAITREMLDGLSKSNRRVF